MTANSIIHHMKRPTEGIWEEVGMFGHKQEEVMTGQREITEQKP
jgi:hypothetical protein